MHSRELRDGEVLGDSLWLALPVYALAPEKLLVYAGAIASTSYG